MNLKERLFFTMVILVFFAILGMAVFGENGLIDLYELKKEHTELIKANMDIARENKSYLNEINRLKNDLIYIESVARKDLGFVSKEEIIFQSKTVSGK